MANNLLGNRKRSDRNENDFYQTPYCLTDTFINSHVLKNRDWDEASAEGEIIADFCEGEGAIIRVLEKAGLKTVGADIKTGYDFLKTQDCYSYGIMNPPFRYFNQWVKKCFDVFTKSFALLAPTTYLQGVARYNNEGTGIYQQRQCPLTHVYSFNRYPLLDKDLREDGKIKTGMLALSWYVWTKKYCKADCYQECKADGFTCEHFNFKTELNFIDINDFVLRSKKYKEK